MNTLSSLTLSKLSIAATLVLAIIGFAATLTLGMDYMSNQMKSTTQIVRYDVYLPGAAVRISQDDPAYVVSLEQCARTISRLIGRDEQQIRCELRAGDDETLSK